MAKLVFLLCWALVSGTSEASDKKTDSKPATNFELKIELLKAIEFPADKEFKKTRIGGISGLVFDAESSVLWAVSDDRGKFGAPRVYKFLLKPDLSLELVDLVFIKDKEKARPVFDFEGISLLPWGNFLMSSEGDDRARPARLPRLIESKINGDYVRDYSLPEAYLPGKSPSEPKGLRTNFGFEGLGMSLDGKSWILGSESWLAQDSQNASRLLKFDMKEAWVLQAGEEWIYKLNYELGLLNGLTDLQNYKQDRWLVLERTAHLEGKNITTQCQLLEIQMGGKDPLKGKPLLDFLKINAKGISTKENYEAMALGPNSPKGRILIVANDNNFTKSPTQFLFFKIREESP